MQLVRSLIYSIFFICIVVSASMCADQSNFEDKAVQQGITARFFLSELTVPTNMPNGSYVDGLEDVLKEILKSGSSTQKETAANFINYMLFNYKSEDWVDNKDFSLVRVLFSDESKREKFLNLCKDVHARQTSVICNPSDKDKAAFMDFINRCNAAIDCNTGIKDVIEDISHLTLESCNYNFNKDLLKICTRLTKYPEFFDVGLKFMQEYSELGSPFSYDDEFHKFYSKLIFNNTDRFCTTEKIQQYVLSDTQSCKLIGALVIGMLIFKEFTSNDLHACKNGYLYLYDLANIIRYIRLNSEDKVHDFIWNGFNDCYANADLQDQLDSLFSEHDNSLLRKDLFIAGMFFSRAYSYQNVNYNFLDISCIYGLLSSIGYNDQNIVYFLDRARSEQPTSLEDLIDSCSGHTCYCHDCLLEKEKSDGFSEIDFNDIGLIDGFSCYCTN